MKIPTRSCHSCTLLLFTSADHAHENRMSWQPAMHYDNGDPLPTCPGCLGADQIPGRSLEWLAFQEDLNKRLGCDSRVAAQFTVSNEQIKEAYRVYLETRNINKTAVRTKINTYVLSDRFRSAGYMYPVTGKTWNM